MAPRPDPKSDIPQGTIDLLVLKAVSLGPLHDDLPAANVVTVFAA